MSKKRINPGSFIRLFIIQKFYAIFVPKISLNYQLDYEVFIFAYEQMFLFDGIVFAVSKL
jgi:hypothetical protein